MTKVNALGYLERNPTLNLHSAHYKGKDWWIIKYRYGNGNKTSGTIKLGIVFFNKNWVGKKIRIKIEEVKK